VVNGKSEDKLKVEMKAYKCKENKCLDPLKDVAIDSTEKLWSDYRSWTDKKVPACDGTPVVVEAGWNMIYDIAGESCPGGKPYQTVIVHGRLTFRRKSASVA